MTIIIQAVEVRGRSGGRNFPAIKSAGKKSPDLAFSNVDRYACKQVGAGQFNSCNKQFPIFVIFSSFK